MKTHVTPSKNPFAGAGIALALFCAVATRAGAQEPHLLAPPKAEEIAAFANDVVAQPGAKEIRVDLQKWRAMEFLEKGEAHPDDAERGKWRELADLALPASMADDPAVLAAKKASEGATYRRTFFNSLFRAEGVFGTKDGKILYWKLWNDRVLRLSDDAGNACLLVLAPENPAQAGQHTPPLLPSSEFPGSDAPEKTLYGKLARPEPGDVTAFADRPDSFYGQREDHQAAGRDAIVHFLERGLVADNLARFDATMDPLAMPGLGDDDKDDFTSLISARGQDYDPKHIMVSAGILLTRDGRVIFWKRVGENALLLMDDQHRTCTLRTDEVARGVEVDKDYIDFWVKDKGRFTSSISREAIKRGPDWTPGTPPPLNAEKAVQIAWGELAKIVQDKDYDFSHIKVASVKLTALYGTGYRKWYYTIVFYHIRPGESARKAPQGWEGAGGYERVATICVALDGNPGELKKVAPANPFPAREKAIVED